MTQRALLITIASALAVAACAPTTTIRRTALIPAATAPARAGGELYQGEVRLSGQFNGVNTSDSLTTAVAQVGDPGVFIPDFHVGGSAYVGLGWGLEIGGQALYTRLEWAHANTPGVLDFPNRDEDLWTGGIGVRYNFPFFRDPAMHGSILTEFNFASVPQAVYVCRTCSGNTRPDTTDIRDLYRFERRDEETFVLPNVAAIFGYDVIPELFVYGIVGAQAGVTNTGFENDLRTLNDSTLETFAMGYVGVGVDFVYDVLAVGGTFYFPIESQDRINFGPSFSFNVGVLLGGAGEPELQPAYEGPEFEPEPSAR